MTDLLPPPIFFFESNLGVNLFFDGLGLLVGSGLNSGESMVFDCGICLTF